MRVAELRSFAAKFHLTVETTVKKQPLLARVGLFGEPAKQGNSWWRNQHISGTALMPKIIQEKGLTSCERVS